MLINNGSRISMTEVPRGAKMDTREVVRKMNIYYSKFALVNKLRKNTLNFLKALNVLNEQ